VSPHVRIAACVDCATPIIGPQLRCAACHADQASAPERPHSFERVVLVWMALVIIEIVSIAVCGGLLVIKECAR
jgi:hypothetical protein